MRLPSTKRGAHPRFRTGVDPAGLDPPLSRAWFLDETTGDYSPSVWGSAGENLGPHNGGAFVTDPLLPYIVDAPVGMGRRFIGSGATSAMSSDSAATDIDSQTVLTTQDATFGAWFKVSSISTFSSVVAFTSDAALTGSANNILFRFAILNSTGKIEINSEHGANVASRWRGNYEFPLDRWIYLCLVRKPNPSFPGTRISYSMYVNGRYIEDVPLDTGPSGNGETPTGGSNAYWQVGGQYTSNGGGQMVVPFTGTVAGIYLWDRQLTASEIEEDYRRGLLLPFHTSSQVRVAVEKPEPSPATTSLYYDATQLDGLDFVSNLNLSNSPDNACVQGSVKFLREQENLSLAYLKNDTKLNLADDSTYNVERFLDVYRQIRIFAATVPLGLDASGDDFWYMLDGRIDLIDWGTEEITVNFRDKGGLLVDTFIEDEVGYGTTPGGAAVIVDDVIDGIVFDNSVDGGKTGSYAGPGDVIYDPPPGAAWAVNYKVQKREPVLVAIRTIAGEFGHDVKFKWDEDSESFRLQLYEPERDSVTLSAVFSPSEIKSISKAELASQRVRNVVRVSYDSAETVAEQNANISSIALPSGITLSGNSLNGDAGLNPSTGEATERTPAFVELENLSSITKYGRRFMEVQEESVSNINLGTEATRMASSMIQDLSEPEFDHSVTVPLLPFLDIHDIVGFQSNAYLYSDNQYLAVSQVSHNFTDEATTTMSVRGQPSLGVRRWMTLESRGAPIPANSPQQASTALTKSQKLQSVQSVLSKTQMNLGGKFTQVRNNAFMTWADGRLNPPTGWSATNTWDNTNILASTVSKTGALSIEIASSGYGIKSDLIPIDGYTNSPYAVEFTWQADNTSTTLILYVEFLDGDGSSIGTTVLAAGSASAALEWETQRGYFAPLETGPPANDARYARLVIAKGAAPGSVYVDNVSVYPAALGCMVKYDDSGPSAWDGLGIDPSVASSIKNIQCSITSSPPRDYYDYGENIEVDANTVVGTYNGTFFNVRESGIYEVFCQSAFNVENNDITAMNPGDILPIAMYILVDAEYDEDGILTSVSRIVAKEITSFPTKGILGSGGIEPLSGFCSVSASFFAEFGERISVAYGSSGTDYFPAGPIKSGSVVVINIVDYTGSDPSSYFSVKQRLLD